MSAIRIVCGVFAQILVAQIVFTLFEANPDKGITRFVANVSRGPQRYNVLAIAEVDIQAERVLNELVLMPATARG